MPTPPPVAPVTGVEVDPLDPLPLPRETVAKSAEEGAVRALQEQEAAPPGPHVVPHQSALAEQPPHPALPATQTHQPSPMNADTS